MFVDDYEDLDALIKEIGIRLGTKLGCGYYGCAYEMQDADGVDLVIKFTSDEQEYDCIQLLVDTKAWKKTAHIPEILKHGGPFRLEDVSDVTTSYGPGYVWYYIREDLVDVPSEFWIDPENASKTNHEVEKAVKSVKAETNICLSDYHMRNWGMRLSELKHFAEGKTKKIPTYVLRDLSCGECE